MFALTPSMSYYLSPGIVDMRKGIYSLYQIVKSELKRNPLSGEVFIFLACFIHKKKKKVLNLLQFSKIIAIFAANLKKTKKELFQWTKIV